MIVHGGYCQGRNFGLKSGGTNSEGQRSILGSRGERGEGWRGSIPSSSDSWVWESVMSSPSGVRGPGRSPSRKLFYFNLNSADRLCWQQVIQQILHLYVLKSGGTVPLSPKSGLVIPEENSTEQLNKHVLYVQQCSASEYTLIDIL